VAERPAAPMRAENDYRVCRLRHEEGHVTTHAKTQTRSTACGGVGFLVAFAVAVAAAFALLAPTATAAIDSSGTASAEQEALAALPRITADKLDYVPGESVSIFGTNWKEGETITLFVDDDETKTWALTADVTAAGDGTFVYSFSLPDWFVATYTVTATGSSGSVASTQFTDTIAWKGVSSNSNGTGTPGSSQLTLNAPAVLAGDVLLVQIVVATGFGESDTICAPAGWERILRTDSEGGMIVVESFYRIATQASASASHTWQFKTVSSACGGAGSERADTGASGGMILYRGVDTTHPLDVPALGASGYGTTATAPRLYTVTNSTRIVRFFGASKAGAFLRGGKIYEQSSVANAERTAVAYDGPLTPAGSTNIFPADMSTEAYWGAQSIALRMAPAPTSLEVSGSATYGGPATLTAKLTSGTTGVAGKTIVFSLNGIVLGSSAVTDSTGVATLTDVKTGGRGAGVYPGIVSAAFSGDAGYEPCTGDGTLTVAKATATLTLSGLLHTYDGTAKAATATTVPAGLETVILTYSQGTGDDKVVVASPTNAGSYDVEATLDNANYEGSANDTLTIAKAATTTTVTCPASAPHTGSAVEPCSATVTGPGGLSQTVTIVYTNNVELGMATATATYPESANHLGGSDTKTFSIVAGCGTEAAFVGPLKDGTRNVVKLGGVIPVRLQLTDCTGAPVAGRTLAIRVVAGIVSGENIGESTELIVPSSTGSADTTGVMRYEDGQYAYNLATKSLATGLPYTVVIRDTTSAPWSSAPTVATAVVEAKK
jgi:hypothetical protein